VIIVKAKWRGVMDITIVNTCRFSACSCHI
jgi:hypothetical protein